MQIGVLRSAVRRALSEGYHKTLASMLVRQSDEAYATHMPILAGLNRIVRPARVLELGSGLCSTPQFLDKAVFPTLETLHSIEDNASWADKVEDTIGRDPRCRLLRVPSVPAWAENADITSYDLIFIDDSTAIADRTRTLKAVLAKASPKAAIVVHDFEVRSYQRAVHGGFFKFVVPAFKPMTGIVTQNATLVPEIEKLRKVILDNRHLSPSDRKRWVAVTKGTPVAQV